MVFLGGEQWNKKHTAHHDLFLRSPRPPDRAEQALSLGGSHCHNHSGNYRHWQNIEVYARAKEAWLRQFLPLEHGIPPHDVYRRVLIRIGPEEIETCFMNWVRTIKNKYEREIAD